MAHASGSQALLSVLDAEETGAQQANGGVPMNTENGNHKSEEDFYGKAPCLVRNMYCVTNY